MTKIATAMAKGSAAEAGERLVLDLEDRLGGAEPVLLVAFCSTAQPLGQVAGRLASRFPRAALIGASTAGEFTEAGHEKGASAVFALAGDYRVFAGIGTGLKADAERAVAQAVEGLPRALHGYPGKTALLLLDPLAGNGEEASLIASSLLGADVRLVGGAAGDDLRMQTTHVACGAKAASDAVVVGVIFSKQALGVGVCHGHRPLSRPLRVTRAEGNVVVELEGRPAWEVWRELTRERAQAHGVDVDRLPREEEGAYLLRYEAGLASGSEYKIRAPLSRSEDGSIHFACGIAEGSVIRITESEAEWQVDSAGEAARRARAQLGGRAVAGALVFDCICRNLILGKDFMRAVGAISHELGQVPLAGFETYGEISLDAGDMSGFHNTTSVVLAFPEAPRSA